MDNKNGQKNSHNIAVPEVLTEVKVGGLTFRNPVITASGTYGFGTEMAAYYDLSKLGGICTKGLTLNPKAGNPPHRLAEVSTGMLNAVGLQNPGIEVFVAEILPQMLTYNTRIIANIAGTSNAEYIRLVEILDETRVDAIELNLSCPNVKEGCMSIGTAPLLIEQVVAACRERTDKPLWVKLTPNVTDIVSAARAAERGGADAIVLINTLLGMAVDFKKRRPVIRNNTGGYSGPGVKPVALRMVSDIYNSCNLPVVGLGGISSAQDALEFMLCGAAAVQVGTACMVDPGLPLRLADEMAEMAAEDGETSLAAYTGALKLW